MPETLPFSDYDYAKLDYRVFPTIRRRDKYGSVGDTVRIEKGPKGSRRDIGRARIIGKESRVLPQFSTNLLLHDTESKSREEARSSLQKFYRTPIRNDEELTLYWLRWEEETGRKR